MRQPRHKMGDKVTIMLGVSNSVVQFETKIPVKGIIFGVQYDPDNSTTGNPFYAYMVRPIGAGNWVRIEELNLATEETKADLEAPRTNASRARSERGKHEQDTENG